MNFPKVIEQLQKRDKLLTVMDVSTIFEVHRQSIWRWRNELNFPEPITIERTCFFRPDLVLAWAIKHRDAERDFIHVEQILERVGVLYKTWAQWIKSGQAPAPRSRELGSGRHLWDAGEIDEWLKKTTGGYACPRVAKPSSASRPMTRARRGPKHHEKLSASAH